MTAGVALAVDDDTADVWSDHDGLEAAVDLGRYSMGSRRTESDQTEKSIMSHYDEQLQ